jgi:hypothetical protein
MIDSWRHRTAKTCSIRMNPRIRSLQMGLLAGLACCAASPLFGADRSTPDFGPNVLVFNSSMHAQDIQHQIDKVYAVQRHNEFGAERNALLFLPGEYHVDVPVGFYTEVLGLGASPDQVHITGNVHADASAPHNNATTTFWRSAEGFSVTPAGGTMQWAVSQAVPMRRMHIRGNLILSQNHGWGSGGWMSDDLVDGTVNSDTQQQWISRNCVWGRWTGSNWNMVFVGVSQAPAGEWPSPPYTRIPATPVIREAPFLEVDSAGNYGVRIPALRTDSSGITWKSGDTPGKTIPLRRFYVAHAGVDTATTLNQQLSHGMNLLLTPGIYQLDEPLRITRPHTVVLGLGFATLKPVNGTAAMTTADVDGIVISGILFDAGEKESPVLLEVGPQGSQASHAEDPISLHDVFFRVGGAGVGRTAVNLRIDSNDTIVDHTWIWRADHGRGVGWTSNISQNGLVVNGNHVTIYGLFVEHHQQYQVIWNGNYGRDYFYQSEIPYDPPDQNSYSSAPGVAGWASYKVADRVTHHEAWGLGIYSVFLQPNVQLTRAIEVPRTPGVRLHHIITVALGKLGSIDHVVDNTGGATSITPRVTPKVAEFPE